MSDTREVESASWITPRDVAAALPNVSYRTVMRWIEQGRLDAERLPGGTYRLPASVLESLPTVARAS